MLNITLDTSGIMDMARALEATGKRLPSAQALVLNRVGTRTRQVVVPTLVRQTGLSKRIITKAVRMFRASPRNPTVTLYARGGNISLKYFNAREVSAGSISSGLTVHTSYGRRMYADKMKMKGSGKGGVLAKIRGEDHLFSGAFRRSGQGANRRLVSKLNGATYINVDGGKWRGRIRSIKSGVLIPIEMVEGATKDAFLDVVNRELPAEIARELAKTLPGR